MSSVLSAIRNPSRIFQKMKNPNTYSIRDNAHKQHIDQKALEKAAAREKENHPPEHSQTMRADLSKALKKANMGGRKTRKRRKRRKRRRKTRRKKNKKKRTKKKARGKRRRRRSTKKGKGLFPGKTRKY
jgi:Skp family chaperone for outer membrane proteins